MNAIRIFDIVSKLDISEFGNMANGQKHVEFALGRAQLSNVDVYIANGRSAQTPPPGDFSACWRAAVRCHVYANSGAGLSG